MNWLEICTLKSQICICRLIAGKEDPDHEWQSALSYTEEAYSRTRWCFPMNEQVLWCKELGYVNPTRF